MNRLLDTCLLSVIFYGFLSKADMYLNVRSPSSPRPTLTKSHRHFNFMSPLLTNQF